MNLILLESEEIDARGRAVIRGRRATHVLEVLRAVKGQQLKVGIVDGASGTATITAISATEIELACDLELDPQPTATLGDTLLLAVPRPQVLARVLEHAAALGFERIVLMRTWRVDKSHLQSHVLEPMTLRSHLLAGLEQGVRTRVPSVDFYARFRPFVEDELETIVPAGARFVADPDADESTADYRISRPGPFAVAIGPERGFTPFEVGMLARAAFVRCGSRPGSCGSRPPWPWRMRS